MKTLRTSIIFWSILVLIFMSTLLFGQRRKRPPWSERSPAIGKKVPDVMIYDKDLNKIPFSNLYKDTLLVIQWGGCT